MSKDIIKDNQILDNSILIYNKMNSQSKTNKTKYAFNI